MQNRYVGDIGDFSKYGMLRVVLKCGLKLGVNWYLYPDEKHANDGKHTAYLDKDKYGLEACDPELYMYLKNYMQQVRNGERHRSVKEIEQSGLLANTQFYSELLFHPNWQERLTHRSDWHEASLDIMKPAQVIFYDPDNGFEVPSVKVTQKKGGKYALYDEVKKQYEEGKSLIVYHHGPLWFKAGELEGYVEGLHNTIIGHLDWSATVECLRWETTAKRFYFWIMRPEHRELMMGCINTLTEGCWGRHFWQVKLK